MENIPRLSVVVCTYNRPRLLKNCLQSLALQTLDEQLFEVIVIESSSRENANAALCPDGYPNYRVIREPAAGLSLARNRGWQEARGEFVAYIDDDAQASPDWAGRILDNFVRVLPRPVAIGGKVLPVHTTKPPFWYSDELEMFSLGETAHFRSSPRSRYGFIGANMAFTREILEQYGGFSHEYGMLGPMIRLGEETELFSRIHQDYPNRFWYDPEIYIHHYISGRSMHLISRCIRSFRSGKALALIDAAGTTPWPISRKILHLVRIVPALPYRIIVYRRRISTELVIFLQDLCERSGYVCTV